MRTRQPSGSLLRRGKTQLLALSGIFALAIGVGSDDQRPPSNLRMDIFTPGVSILGAWINGTTAENTISGTSMGSPHVAGVATLYLSSNPGATPAQVEANIKGAESIDCVATPKARPMYFSSMI